MKYLIMHGFMIGLQGKKMGDQCNIFRENSFISRNYPLEIIYWENEGSNF